MYLVRILQLLTFLLSWSCNVWYSVLITSAIFVLKSLTPKLVWKFGMRNMRIKYLKPKTHHAGYLFMSFVKVLILKYIGAVYWKLRLIIKFWNYSLKENEITKKPTTTTHSFSQTATTVTLPMNRCHMWHMCELFIYRYWKGHLHDYNICKGKYDSIVDTICLANEVIVLRQMKNKVLCIDDSMYFFQKKLTSKNATHVSKIWIKIPLSSNKTIWRHHKIMQNKFIEHVFLVHFIAY